MSELPTKALTLLVACLVSLGTIESSSAQNQSGQWDLMIPSVSALVPLSNVLDENALGTGAASGQHELSAMFGGRLTYWFVPHMAAELEFLFAPSALENAPFGIAGTNDAQFFAINARLVHTFNSKRGRPYFLLTGGLGIWATNYADYEMITGAMGVLALGFHVPLDNALSFRLDLSDYLTTINWELSGENKTDRILQNDLALTAGFIITLNKK